MIKSSLPILKVLIGIPGSGKSRWVKNQKNYFVVCPDKIREKYFGDISDQSNNSEVWNIAKGMVIAAIILNKNVILDGTNVNTHYRKQFLNNLPPCKMHALLFDVNPKVAYKRINADIQNGKNRSNVSHEVIYRMYGEFLYTKQFIHEEGFDKVIFKL